MRTRLMPVGEEEAHELIADAPPTAQPQPTAQSRAQSAGLSLLVTALGALSMRTIVALAAIVDLLMIGSVFWICFWIIGEAKPMQLAGVAGYGAFILAALALRKRAQ